MKKHVTLFSSVLMMSTTLLGAGGVLAEEITPNPASEKTPVSAVLSIDTSKVPTLPGDGSEGGHDNNNTDGAFGIAYQPKTLSGSKQLVASGADEISLSHNSAAKLHVGVKDLTRKKHAWDLKASVSWDGDNSQYMTGATIDISGGKVQKNVDGNLSALDNAEVTGESNVSISSDAKRIMSSDGSKTTNAIYDYEFSEAKLKIPNAENVPAGTYSGNINWNLSITPTY